MPPKTLRRTARPLAALETKSGFDLSWLSKTVARYAQGEPIFAQGDDCRHVLYIKAGGVTLSVLSKAGRKAIVATLGPGQFFGEGGLAGQRVRTGTATATAPTAILRVGTARLRRLLRARHDVSDRFISHMLTRNNRIEADLVAHLLNTIERRVASALLLGAGYGLLDTPVHLVPRTSQATLAITCGTTASRVRFFLKKFSQLGFIEYDSQNRLSVNGSLLSVVLHE